MARKFEHLTEEQVEQFLMRGFIRVEGAFTADDVKDWTDSVFPRLGYDPNDKSTWKQWWTAMPLHNKRQVSEMSPKTWAIIGDILGGIDRVEPGYIWHDGLTVNLGSEDDHETWQPPSATVSGWHKDGDFFRHFLDSPEQALLTIILFSDVEPKCGATFLAADSVPIVARGLAGQPEGFTPGGFPIRDWIGQCHDFFEATGKIGDVFLMHPFMLHAASKNARRIPRYIINPAIKLREPMCFDRDNPDDYSLVELSILRALGVDRYPFEPTAPREKIVPARVVRQQAMLEEEKKRMEALAAS